MADPLRLRGHLALQQRDELGRQHRVARAVVDIAQAEDAVLEVPIRAGSAAASGAAR